MIALHLSPSNSADYFERRDRALDRDLPGAEYGSTYREAHIRRCLAMRHVVVAAGPSTDGRRADVFYQVDDVEHLERVVEGDPYVYGGVWVDRPLRIFREFVEPQGRVPVCLDGSRQITAVEGEILNRDRALANLRAMRARERLVCGGIFEKSRALAWVRVRDPGEATAWLVESGGWAPEGLATHSMVWVL